MPGWLSEFGFSLTHGMEMALFFTFQVLVIGVFAFMMRQRQIALRENEARLRNMSEHQEVLQIVAENASDGIVFQEMDATIIWANSTYCQIMGWDLEDIIGRKPQEFCFPPELRPTDEEIEAFVFDPESPEFHELTRRQNIRKNGERFWHEINLAMVEPSPGHKRVILVTRDVSEHVERERELERTRQQLEHAATHDALTGLSNRGQFLKVTQALLDTQTADAPGIGILHIDLDHFKSINDSRGHAAGDRILVHVADTIRSVIREGDLACRLGGDEFVVLCRGLDKFSALEGLARRFLNQLEVPIDWHDGNLRASASVGIAVSDARTTSADALIRNADFALYEAKKPENRRVAVFDTHLHARQESESRLIAEFDRALDDGKLEFVFQPILDLEAERCGGFEALARWTTQDGEQIPPPQFIEYAGQLGRKADIDFAAMEATIDLLAEALARGHDLKASFNSSTASLARPDFLTRLEWQADKRNIDRQRVVVEVLETTFLGTGMTDNHAVNSISDLCNAGYEVFLDDFGVGFAGLAHLAKLKITGIKLDQSLVLRMPKERPARLIVDSMLHLAEVLGLTALAEGVENSEQVEILRASGCRYVQGYAVARPMSRTALLDFLDGRSFAVGAAQDPGRISSLN